MSRLPKVLMSLSATIKDVGQFLRLNPSPIAFRAYLSSILINGRRLTSHSAITEIQDFREYAKGSLDVSADWFTHNIPAWSLMIRNHFEARQEVRVLEIGSYEGLSTNYILTKLPNSIVTCVDTWEGSTEHQESSSMGNFDFRKVKSRFDTNTSKYANRVIQYQGTSQQFFSQITKDELFDLIYVDGSHSADDVLVDAINSFRHLRVGGILIFDDYRWRFFKHRNDNPGPAIDAFLALKKSDLELLHVGYQVIIRRTSPHR